MRLVFTIVALTGLLGLSVERPETTEIAGLDLENVQLTVAEYPDTGNSTPFPKGISPFEKTAYWAIGLFIGEPQTSPLNTPDPVDLGYVDLSKLLPVPISYGPIPQSDVAAK